MRTISHNDTAYRHNKNPIICWKNIIFIRLSLSASVLLHSSLYSLHVLSKYYNQNYDYIREIFCCQNEGHLIRLSFYHYRNISLSSIYL